MIISLDHDGERQAVSVSVSGTKCMSTWILDDQRRVVRCENLPEWFAWMKSNRRRVAVLNRADAMVITCFSGMDMHGGPEPLVFETRVSEGKRDGETLETPTWEKAVAAHEAMCLHVWPELTLEDVRVC